MAFDAASQVRERHSFGPGTEPGELTFVPRRGGVREHEGYLMGYVCDPDRGASDLVVLNAEDITAGPIARVHLPVRVPNGFHGNWFPSEAGPFALSDSVHHPTLGSIS